MRAPLGLLWKMMIDRNVSKESDLLFEELLKDRTRRLEELLRFEQDLIDAIPVPVFFRIRNVIIWEQTGPLPPFLV